MGDPVSLSCFANKIFDKVFDPIVTYLVIYPITALYLCKKNVMKLKIKLGELAIKKLDVQHRADEAEQRGEEIFEEVKQWMSEADEHISGKGKADIDELIAKAERKYCFGWCPNPKATYDLSEKAKEFAAVVDGLTQMDFARVSYFRFQKQESIVARDDFVDFESRNKVLEEIMKALQSPTVDTIGVHGMLGMGKTMLVKEVKRKAEQEKLFDVVVMANVTRNPDLTKIVEEISRGLGMFQLPKELSPRQVADRINGRLTKKNALVILDDIWEKIDLKDLGIPSGSKQKRPEAGQQNEESSLREEQKECKVLLTSREQKVLSEKMSVKNENIFHVDKLEDDEARELFKLRVEDDIESSHRSEAIMIVKKCSGLPLAIEKMAMALRGKEDHHWNSLLQELKASKDGEYAVVRSAIEFSFSQLESEALQQTFLLCCLMGHDASIEDLMEYGTGLKLFPEFNKIEDFRAAALHLVNNLRDSSLLLNGPTMMQFDMQDAVQDAAISIASKDRGVLASKDEDATAVWPDEEAISKKLNWIYLSNADISQLLPELELVDNSEGECQQVQFPQLTFFHLSNKYPSSETAVPADFFKAMKNLRVLSLTKIHFSSIPRSISLLTKLRTLRLNQSKFGVLEGMGEIIAKLKKLQVLNLAGCDITELPIEIACLTRLKLLDMSDCTNLKVISPDVLSKLSGLEELKMANSFDQWQCIEQHENQNGTASLAELKHLQKLSTLEVCINDIEMIPEGLFNAELKKYKIFVGDLWKYRDSSSENSKLLKIELKAGSSHSSIIKLLKDSEELHLEGLHGVKNVVYRLDNEGFQKLRYLYVRNAPEIQFMIDSERLVCSNALPVLEELVLQNLTKMEKICRDLGATSFNKLRIITIECCHQLKNLFSFSIVEQLLQLQEIRVKDCENIEEIVAEEAQVTVHGTEEAPTKIKLGKVQYLRLEKLPKLIGFCSEKNSHITDRRGSLLTSSRCKPLFNEKVVFPMLEELELTDIKIGEIWNTTLATPDYTQKLTKLSVVLCSNLKYLFSSSVADGLMNLLHLEIRSCKSLREIIAIETGPEMGNCHVKFLSLKQLIIIGCPELVGFMVKSKSTNEADNFQPFFNEQVAFPSLESLILYSLKNLHIIWHNQLSPDSFCKLKELDVRGCENLMTIFTEDILGTFFKSIEKLTISSCASIEEVFKVGEINFKESVQTQLRNLWIFNLPSLKHVWNEDPKGILTFHNIESVIVSYCPSIRNLFPVSVTEGLKQLQKLQIERCGVEEIVAMGRGGTEAVVKFVFPRLSNLKLMELSRLRYFYPRKHITLWPELKKLDVFSCSRADQVEIRNGQDQPNFPSGQPFLCMEEIIPQLERLSLSQDDIAMISEFPFKQDFFFKIKALRIDGGGEFPIGFLRRFYNLEKFALRDCSLKELFPSDGVVEEEEQSETQLPRIKTLKLQRVFNLKHVWSGELSRVLQNLNKLKVTGCHDLISLSTSTTSFKNLTTLEVSGCLKMENLVSAATVQCLVHVKSMTVSDCVKLTEIVGGQGDLTQDPIIFSSLRYLKLNHLRRLASFSSGNCTLDFPYLEQLIVEQCPKLEIFTKTVPKTPRLLQVQGGKLWKLEVDLNTTIQRMYTEKVGYVGLIALSLSEFPGLMRNWHTKILDLRLLQDLDICNCHSLRYLLSPSMVRSLVFLRELKVENCTIMEAVIMEEGAENAMMEEGAEKKIIFPHLVKISLDSCSDLASFYLGSCTLQCLGLKTIVATNCRKLVTFTSLFSAEQEKEDSQALFSDKVDFPNLQFLILRSLSIQKIWRNQDDCAQNLLHLSVVGCGNLKYLVISSVFKTFEKLQWLEICDCGMMEEVIVREGYLAEEERMYKMFFPKLDYLLLNDLRKLKRFCFGNLVEFSCLRDLLVIKCPLMNTFISSSISGNLTANSEKVENTCTPPLFDSKVAFPSIEKIVIESMECLNKIWPDLLDAESFCHLNHLRVNSCGMLLNIFPSTMLERIQKLDKLEIWNCNSLEEIFESKGHGAIQSQSQITTQSTLVEAPFQLVLPKLTHLHLYGLPKLKGFYRRMHVTEWPLLKKLEVYGCDQVQIFSSEFSSFRRTNGDDQFGIEIKCPLFSINKATFPSLEELELNKNDILKEIWHGEYPGDYFPKLKVLKLTQFPEQSVVYPVLFQSPNLEKLVVSKALFHELFQCQGLGDEEKPELALTQLSESRSSELLESVFYNLKALEVLQCSKLKNLVSSFISFKNLTTLVVFACHELVSLIGYSTAKSMVQLTRMSISECHMLKDIVACLDDDVKDGIVFNRLKYFQLRGLPRLASFCSGNCSFEFASLEDVLVMGCPKMQIFSKGECNTPNKLQKVKLTVDEDEWFWEGNLNSTIQKMFREKVGYRGLEALKLFEFPELIEIWHKKPQENLPFKRLKFLEVCNCSKLRYLLTPSMALGLVQLHDLKVINCAMMEQVITGEATEEMFPLLNSILLESCSNLTCFYEGSSRLKFTSLKQITVVDCPILVAFASLFPKEQEEMMTADDRGSEERPYIHTQPFFNEKVVIPNLEELQLLWMNVNIKWHTSMTSLYIRKLKKLIIQGCDNLKYLLSSSLARGLVMLGELEIKECKRMREIIIIENAEEKENLIFPQLNYLLIEDLQNLVGFYSRNCIVEFPSLENLQVLNCPKLKGFTVKYPESTNYMAKKQTLFNEQVAFPNLKWMSISHLRNLEIIWPNKLYSDSFCRLKSLAISNCEKLSTVFPSGDIQGRIWKSLKKLTLYRCGLLEEIFEIGEFNVKQTHAIIDTKLRKLIIDDLPRLKRVWNKDPQGILTFHNLESVKVSYCGSLKNLFPASIGKSLLQLQKLHLFQCGVEEIVTMGGEQGAEAVVNFEFHRVSSLKLELLPRLQCFYPGKHTTAWPMLKKFYFSHFNQVKRIDACGQLDFPVRLPLFSIEKVIPQLEELSLTRHDIAMICERQLKPDLIYNVKVLQILDDLGDESDVLPIRFLERFLHLEKLVVRLCKFKELFPSKEVEEQEKHGEMETLSRIKTLNLKSLPFIKHVWSHDSSSVLQNLETLEISNCHSLIRISSSSAPFQNLTSLWVSYCKGMINFVSVSIAQSLAQLQSMVVEGCHKLIEIVENEGDGVQDFIIITFSKLKFLKLKCLTRLESFCSGNFTFKFPSLENVIVNQCPKLKIFSEGNLNTPLLHRIEVTEGEDKWRWAGDLNTTIQKMYMEKVGFVGLEDLILSEFPEWMKIWHYRNPQKILDFRQLEILEIYDCNNFRYLLTSSMALGLVQLLQLIVKSCGTMEQVIMGEGAKNQMEFPHLWLINLESCSDLTSFYVGSHSLELPGLINFIVKDCPKMVTFATSESSKEHDKEESQCLFSSKVETPNLEFLNLSTNNIHRIFVNSIPKLSSYVKNLRELCVEGCGNLRYLLTSSMVKSFEQLNWLEICDCKMMEEVILAEESVSEERMCKIFFPNLEFLLLQDLPKLTRFCSGKYLKLPLLWKLKISKCPVLKTFISSFAFGDITTNFENANNTCTLPLFDAKVAFPKLECLVIEYVESLNKIWSKQLTADSFYQLTLMSVVSCEKVLNIFPFSMLERLKKLDKLQIWNCDSLEEIFESQELGVSQLQAQKATPLPLVETVTKFAFPKLTHLDLYGLPKLKGFFLQMHIFEWPSLKKLWIYGCDQVQIFASELSSFQRTRDDDQLEIQIKHPLFWLSKATFPCLEELILEKNNILKEIWNGQHPGDYLPKLKVVKLICLREQSALPSFFFQSLPNLERLVVSEASFDEIFHCESLNSKERPVDTPTQLSELKLSKLNELRHLWKEESNLPPIFYNLRTLEVLECSKLMSLVPSIVSFENLQSLEVSRSHGLINLVRYSTAKSLAHLTRMSITDCDLIEEIVACLEDEVKDGIVFSKLKYLQLCGLPRLSSFCSVKCKFGFPFLEEVMLMDCPSVQIFCMDEITTPKLQKVKMTVDEDEGFWDGNLNSTIQLQFMQKSGGDFGN